MPSIQWVTDDCTYLPVLHSPGYAKRTRSPAGFYAAAAQARALLVGAIALDHELEEPLKEALALLSKRVRRGRPVKDFVYRPVNKAGVLSH